MVAKGGYMCIGYPDKIELNHCTINSIVEDAQRLGAEVAYIFHDKDTAVPHYHFIFMWKKSVLPFKNGCTYEECEIDQDCYKCKLFDFIKFMQLHGLKAPRSGTNIIYDYNTAVIKDIDCALDYMLHE